MAYDFFPGIIKDIIKETETVKRFFIELINQEVFDFTPGQFIMLDLPIKSKRTTRSYSIASNPSSTNVIELIIVLKPDGAGTPYLFNSAKIGTPIKVSKAIGKFVLPEQEPDEICFICTGTGVAPFRSMILDKIKKQKLNRKIHLIFGCRYEDDILYREEFERIEKYYPNFNYYAVLSRGKWLGRMGYVHSVYKELYKDKRPSLFYICGWKNMIIDTRNNLLEMGYDKQNIKFELYD